MLNCDPLIPSLDFGCSFSKVTTYCLHRLDLRPSLDLLYKAVSQGLHSAKDCAGRARRAEL